jgi:hypothetical protein
MQELLLGIETPFLAGYGDGGGSYTAGDESGGFLSLSGGALGKHVSVGVEDRLSETNNYITPWGLLALNKHG